MYSQTWPGVSGILVFRPFYFWYIVFYCQNRFKYGYKALYMHIPKILRKTDVA
jgi:hypothetical protein